MVTIETLNKINYFDKKKRYIAIEVFDSSNFDCFLVDEKDVPKNGLETLLYVMENGADFSVLIKNMIKSVKTKQKVVCINGTEFSWEEIKHLF